MRDYIIVIPSYQPTEMLLILIEKLEQSFKKIVIVNDGSGKDYDDIYNKIDSECIVLNHYTNMGKGRALKTAFNYCIMLSASDKYDGVITVDADGQHSVRSIIAVRDKMEERPNNIVLGVRSFSKEIPARSRIGNNITRYVFQWLCGLKVSDTQTGLRGIPSELLEFCCGISGEKYEYETNMLLCAKNESLSISEVPIETIYINNNATSHFHPLRDSIKIYQTILLYSISSVIAVVIDFLSFSLFFRMGLEIMMCTYIGRIFSACANFLVNRKVVFKSSSNAFIQLMEYLALVFVSGTISGLAVSAISKALAISPVYIKMIIELLLYFINYYVQNTFIFRRKTRK